jgi:hypothetical protein
MKAKQVLRMLAATLVLGGLLAATSRFNANAQPQGGPQGRRNFDPAQFQQMIMDRLREAFEVKNDDEWKIIQERLQKVMDARMAGMALSGGMGMPGMGRPPGGGGRGFMGGAPNPEADALQQAVDAKASAQDLKDKLAKFREARKANEAKLEAAQEDLRQVLSVKQEAIAALSGLVK